MRFINIKWDMTYKCNLNCRHCLNSETRKGKKDLPYDQLLAAFEKLHEVDLIGHIQFLGGEPTVHAHFCEVVRALRERDISIGVNTNCIKVDRLESVIEDIHEVNVSLEGPTKETHEYIRGLDQFSTFERVLTNLKRLQNLKEDNGHTFNLIISCVVTRHNLPVLEDMIDLSLDVGANGLNLLQLVEEGNAALEKELQITADEKMEATERVAARFCDLGLTEQALKLNVRYSYNKVIDYLRKERGLTIPYTNHSCGAGITFGYMNQNAELYPCDRLCPDYHRIAGNETLERLSLLEKDFYEVWESGVYSHAFRLQCSEETYENCLPCRECAYLQKACYPCPVQVANSPQTVIEECMRVEES